MLLGELLPQASLGDGIDQQDQGHHHQQALDAGGFFHKERGGEKQRLFEETETTFSATLSFVVGQEVFILDLLGIDGGGQHETGFALLLGASFFGIDADADADLELPVGRLDRCVGGRTAFVGIVEVGGTDGLPRPQSAKRRFYHRPGAPPQSPSETSGLADAYEEQRQQAHITDLSFDERLAMPVERQWLWKENRAWPPGRALPDSSNWLGSMCWSSTTGTWSRSSQTNTAFFSRSSTIGRTQAPPSSPVNIPSRLGISWPTILPWPMPSWTGSSTTPTKSN